MVNLEEFKDFKYNPETGEIFNTNGKIQINPDKSGYYRCNHKINGKWETVKAHRLAWFLYHGETPNIIDHINGVKSDNRIENLRNTNTKGNNHNRKAKGGCYHKRDKLWQASIVVDGKQKYIGSYKTEEEMYQAYLEAKEKYHGPNRFVNKN